MTSRSHEIRVQFFEYNSAIIYIRCKEDLYILNSSCIKESNTFFSRVHHQFYESKRFYLSTNKLLCIFITYTHVTWMRISAARRTWTINKSRNSYRFVEYMYYMYTWIILWYLEISRFSLFYIDIRFFSLMIVPYHFENKPVNLAVQKLSDDKE